MKLAFFTISAAFILSSSIALASDQAVKPAKVEKSKKTTVKKAQRHDVVTVTGSHLDRDVRHDGMVSAGPHALYIIDSDSIRNSGATDIRELLTHRGVRR